MSSKTKTVVDKDGDVWTGRTESPSHGIGDLVFGMLTGGVGLAAVGSSEPTTVVVNGERHTGRECK